MLNSGGNTSLFPPFGSLSGEVSPVLPFDCIFFEQLVVVQVDGGGIGDCLGRNGDRDCCVGDSGRHRLSYGHDKDP